MGEHELVCHKMEYPAAMFLCHAINKTTVYKVPLVGRDGTKANALAVCHKETSGWNPKRMAFQILKLKPGTIVFLSSQGIVLEEAYWKSVFPNNPMPKALRDILPPSDSINGSIKDSNASYHAGSYRNEQSIQGNSTGPSKEFSAPSSLGAYQAGSYRNEQLIQDYSGNGTGSYEEFSAPSFLGAYQAGSYGNKQSIQDYSSNNTGLSKEFSAPSSLGVDQAGGYENEQSIQDYSGNNTGLFKEFSAPSSLGAYQTGSYGNEQSIQDYSGNNTTPSKKFSAPSSLGTYHAGSYGNKQSIQANVRKIIFAEASIDSNLNNNFKVDDNIVSVDETTFFFQRDLRTGKLVNLPNLIATGDKTPFLPDRVAKSIPFSSAKLPEILNHFSLKPQTRDANTIGETIRGCERAAINGEQKFCATSLESFIDLSISKLGKQIQLLSIEFSKETKNPLFTISRGMQNMGEHELVCHKMEYPGAVFLCHALNKTGVYKVPLVGRDGTKANALAVCHKDTSGWNPKHMAFQILKVKPGTVPICHFLFRDTLVWVSNSTAK
ncbi:polygalacturonase non-catalytic subunit AroGP2 [Gossypium hirsutum]|uniref:Polygalacturonase non-catalytic subunit AroGP2 n=1 Tax=Gossypium hirsutum TaxID=3635 RepID=A0ABM2YJ81_GOSHI|nr:polygalacturonase non-catalytic subunit AroGP2-like [Gossypium hirsutum]